MIRMILVFSIVILAINTKAQNSEINHITLEDAIYLAHKQSPDALVARHELRRNYWEHRSFQADYLPSLTMDATLPNINRSIDKITLPDGSDEFIERSLANYDMNMAVNQKVPFTGGDLFVNSGLQRIDVFTDSTITSYQSSPVSIGYRQPVFGFNEYKWDRKTQPLRYEKAKRDYIKELQEISITTTDHFFNLLKAQMSIHIAELNKANTDTLYKIAQGRYNLGKIAENELLQMELSMLNADEQLEQTKIDYVINLFSFRSYLGIRDSIKISLIPPKDHPKLEIEVQKALTEAKENRPEEISYQTSAINAMRQLQKAKAENRFNANIYAEFGLTQKGSEINEVYQNPSDQERFTLGLQIPILDWGVGKGKVKMAESGYELVKTTIEQNKINFEQEVMFNVMNFNVKDKQLEISAKADTVAQKRFNVAKQRYLIGKIDITDLNLALKEKDQSWRNYINAMHSYWRSFYKMRQLTLYDFIKNKKIKTEFSDILDI